MYEKTQIRLLYRNLEIFFGHYEPQTPGSKPIELVNLLACYHFDWINIAIYVLYNLTQKPDTFEKRVNRRPRSHDSPIQGEVRNSVESVIGKTNCFPGKGGYYLHVR